MSTAAMGGVVGAAALLLCGCRVFDEGLLDPDAGGPGRDAGNDAGDDAGLDAGAADAGPSCPLTRPPPRPGVGDGSGPDVVFALENIDLDQRGGWSGIGYDLDGLCTTLDHADVECEPPSPSSSVELDGEGGIDNVLGHEILPLVITIMSDLPAQSILDMHQGIGAIIVQVRGWNGMADDPRVDAVVAQSVFGTPGLADGGVPDPEIPDGGILYDDGGMPPLPRWDGTDWWWVRVETFLDANPERPMIHDDTAYVANDTLVVHLPDRVPIILSGTVRAAIIKLTDSVLTLHVSADRQTVDRAVLAGRWAISDVLGEIEHANICRNTDFYRTFSHLLDLTADVRAIPSSGGAGATCDAISVGATFTGTRAHFGGLSDLFRIPSPCADAGVDGG